MVALAETLLPREVTLVPERREEVTTEGGLDVARQFTVLRDAVERIQRLGITCSLFIDAHAESIRRAADTGARAIELHTGPYAHAFGHAQRSVSSPANVGDDLPQLALLRDGAALATSLGLAVHAGHGLTARNVGPVAAIPEVQELNIGHSIVSHALFLGLDGSVRAVHEAMRVARAPVTQHSTTTLSAVDDL
jgi:pyridoxine 5-phosphate synthase